MPARRVSADVVTAASELVRASASEHPDLFWAFRGGGGNFGVVTSFELKLHPVGPQVTAGLIVHPFEGAKAVLHEYRRLCAAAPDELCCWGVMRKAPPLPFLPKEVHGTEVLALALCYAGDVAAAEKAAQPFRAIGKPIADVVGPHPFAGWQTAFDPLLTPGARNHWKSHAAAATAYPHRDVNFVMNVHTRWSDAAQDKTCIEWARGLYAAAAPFATGGVYVNFMPEDEAQRVQAGAKKPART